MPKKVFPFSPLLPGLRIGGEYVSSLMSRSESPCTDTAPAE